MTDLPVWLGVVVAALVGIGGWVTAGIANGRAKKANRLAEAANTIAASAVTEAKAANRISKGANKLSEEANTLVKGQVSQQNEDWYVKWKGKWDSNSAMLVLTNEGRDPAREVSCVVVGGGIHEIGRPGVDVAPGEDFKMHLPQVTEQRTAHEVEIARGKQEMRGSGIIWIPGQFKSKLEITIIWKTGLGATQDQVIDKTVT